MSDSQHYDRIVRTLCEDREVSVAVDGGMKRFGASGELRAGGKMFAFCSKERLILKLPQSRVAALIAEGLAEPCVMGNRKMREWVVVGLERESEWLNLAVESKNFVLGKDGNR